MREVLKRVILLLIILSNILPVDRIRSHVRSGADILLQNSAQYQYADGYVSAILDNTTDDLILAKVVYQSENPVQDAVMVPSYSYPGEDAGGLILFETLNRTTFEDAQIDIYPVYWHGYLAILRPLFLILTYSDLRILNQILELLLLIAVLYLMQKRSLDRFIPAFAVMIAFWNPGTMGVSLQYAPCYYLSMGGAAVLLLAGDRIRQGQFLTFMMLIGALTSYLDFLTYPAATFGVPMIFAVLLRRESCLLAGQQSEKSGIRVRMMRFVQCGIWWVIGYIGMWAEKWIYGSILCRTNILTIAAGKISERASTEESGETITRLGTVLYLLRYALMKKPYVILVVIFAVMVAVMCCIATRKRGFRLHAGVSLGTAEVSDLTVNECESPVELGTAVRVKMDPELLAIAVIPLIWYFGAANHSHMHPRLVYRSMGIMVFAVCAVITEMVLGRGNKTRGKQRKESQ